MRSATVMVLTAAVAALACVSACSIPEKQLIDAAPAAKGPPFACFGQLPPTTANPQITITGNLIKAFSQETVPTAPIEVHANNPDALITTIMTNSDGAFTYSQATARMPQDLFLRTAPPGFLETRYYPAAPIVRDLKTDVQVLTTMDLATLAAVAGISIDTTKATFVVTVSDCNGDPVAGAMIATQPVARNMLYLANGRPSTTAVATDSFTGTAFAANVDISSTTITATVGTMTLHRSPIAGAPGVIVQAEIQP
jgi:hypothetical protein